MSEDQVARIIFEIRCAGVTILLCNLVFTIVLMKALK